MVDDFHLMCTLSLSHSSKQQDTILYYKQTLVYCTIKTALHITVLSRSHQDISISRSIFLCRLLEMLIWGTFFIASAGTISHCKPSGEEREILIAF